MRYEFADGKWTVFVAEVGYVPQKKGALWTPLDPAPPKIVHWRKQNVLTQDGRVLEVEQKC